jgi:hypothetical protein
MGIYGRFVAWLIRPGIERLSIEPKLQVQTVAMASPGDILILSAKIPLRSEQRAAVHEALNGAGERFGLRMLMLEQGIEVAQLIKLHDKSGDDSAHAHENGDKPAPFPKVKLGEAAG